jgi:hypothetical protein
MRWGKKVGLRNRLQNLVKGVKESIFAQVIENAAKINLQTMSQSPVATCYSEYIE